VAALGYGSNGATETAALAVGATKLGIDQASFDCSTDALDVSNGIVYRRTDDPNNANIYKAPSDTGKEIASVLMLTRGSASAYLAGAAAGLGTATAYASATGSVTGAAALTAAAEPLFVNGYGPFMGTAATPTVFQGSTFKQVFPRDWHTAAMQYPTMQGITTDAQRAGADKIESGDVLLVHGRRYRVKTRGATGDAGLTGKSYVQLSENYAGGGVLKVCSSCVDQYDGSKVLTLEKRQDFALGDRLAISGRVHEDFFSTVMGHNDGADQTTGATDALKPIISAGGSRGTSGLNSAENALAQGTDVSLYKAIDGAMGTKAVIVQESSAATATTYNYVAQCSNRGTCDAATGLCKCFKGYSNDNCNEQNMLAA